MNKLLISGLGEPYEIWYGNGMIGQLSRMIRQITTDKPAQGFALVTDETVWGFYEKQMTDALNNADIPFTPIVMTPGESSKSLAGLSAVYEGLHKAGVRRDGVAIAFGGGVVGDLCGFAAATYMRGIRYIQVPTTLLAQVDSSVGGKTAVNLPFGKNLAGAFYPPRGVLMDTAFLNTLTQREFNSGFAEIVKYGAICDTEMFSALHEDFALEEVIAASCKIKGDIVGRDALDQGERALLNFGHTFGHAIEACGGFATFTHGEAVAIGMVMAAKFGEALGKTKLGTSEKIEKILIGKGMQTKSPYALNKLLPIIETDKKSKSKSVQFILLEEVGSAYTHDVPFTVIQEKTPASCFVKG